MTRWHEADLAGRLLADPDGEPWKVLNLPALAEADDPLGRAPGEAVDYYKLLPITYAAVVIMAGFMVLTLTADIINPINPWQ